MLRRACHTIPVVWQGQCKKEAHEAQYSDGAMGQLVWMASREQRKEGAPPAAQYSTGKGLSATKHLCSVHPLGSPLLPLVL